MHAFGRETKCMFFLCSQVRWLCGVDMCKKIVAKEAGVAAYPFCQENEVPNF